MGDLTKNISRYELRCKCGNCNYQSMDIETINAIQGACDHFSLELGFRVTLYITSAARCFKYNLVVGSNDDSMHPRMCAIDHYIKGVSMKELFDYYNNKYPGKFGIGLYKLFVHLDSRPNQARW